MFIEPRQLIAETIDKLELYPPTSQMKSMNRPVLRASAGGVLAGKEAVQTIKVLIPKLRTAQGSLAGKHAAADPRVPALRVARRAS